MDSRAKIVRPIGLKSIRKVFASSFMETSPSMRDVHSGAFERMNCMSTCAVRVEEFKGTGQARPHARWSSLNASASHGCDRIVSERKLCGNRQPSAESTDSVQNRA
eukprot:scaffold624_cov402-Prasinococcus_capsulatus_cf.AAC.5